LSIAISSSLTNVSPEATAQPVAARPAATEPTPSAAQPAAPVQDTVQISSLAQAAVKEAVEMPAQTAHEAATGDVQAKRLLAKEAADKAL
jgi:hypothetical protein